MKKLLKRLLILTLALVVVLILVVGVTLAVFDPNEHKEFITSRVENATGRSFDIAGNISISYYPWLGLQAEGITLGNAEGFGDEPMVHMDTVAVRIKTLPLLRKQYVLDTFRLHGLRVNLSKNKEGVSNWADLTGEGEKPRAEDKRREDRGEPLAMGAFVLGGVDVKNGQISWNDRANEQQIKVSNINLQTGELIYGEPIKLNLNLDTKSSKPALQSAVNMTGTLNYDRKTDIYAFKPFDFRATLKGQRVPGGKTDLTINGALETNLDEDKASISNLMIAILDTQVKVDITASNIQSGKPATEGQVTASGSDLARVLNIFELEAGQDLARLPDRSFDLQLNFKSDARQDSVQVPELKAELLGATINAELDASQLSEEPAAKGSLKAEGQNLPALLQLAGQFQGGDSPLLSYGQKLASVPDKAFSVATVFEIDMKEGDVLVDELSIKTLGLTAGGRLNAEAITGRKGSMDGEFNLTGKNLKPILKALDQGDLGEVLNQLTVNAVLKGDKGEFSISPLMVKATLAGQKIPNSPVDMILTADTLADMDKQRLTIDKLSLQGLGLNLMGEIKANDILEDPAFEGRIELPAFNLRTLARQLNQDLPETADKTVLKTVALSTDFAGNRDSLKLDKLKVTLDETHLNGRFSLVDFAEPDIGFDINIDAINADRYLPPKQAGQAKPATPETGAAASSELPVEMLRSLKVKGDLAIGKVVISNATLEKLRLGLQAREGDIQLDPIKAELYEGNYDGVVVMDAKGEALKLLINTRLDNVNLDPLLKDYMQQPESPLAGIANVALNDLTASGRNVDQIKQTVTGTGKLNVSEGILRGIDIRKVLEQLEIMLESKRFTSIQSEGNTPFEKLTATLNIKNGVITNNDLLMLASGFRVTGKGMIANLNDETIKYTLKTTVDETRTEKGEEAYNIGGYAVPINCRGTFEKPKCVPDADQIAKVLFKKTGEEKLKELIGEKLGIGGSKEPAPAPEGTAPTGDSTTQQAAPEKESTEPKSEEEQLKEAVEGVLKGFF